MRVGLYTECLRKRFTGVEVQTLALVNGLKEIGHEVTCFHSRDVRHPDLGVRHHVFRRALPVPFYNQFAAFFHRGCFDGLDVLHLPHPQMPYVRKPGVPVVMTVHDITPVFLPRFHNAKRVFFFRHVLPRYLRGVDRVIAASESTKRDLVRYYGMRDDEVQVVHQALPFDVPEVARVEKEGFILFLGTLEPRKNVEGLLRAYAALKAKGFRERLVIAGGLGWKYDGIFSLLRELGLGDEVEWRGYVSEEEKMELYKRARLFVYPSWYEGFGVPVLEAMAYGTPVVTSNVSSLPEIVGDAGVLVDPSDPADIARGMEEVLGSEARRRELVRLGRSRVAMFSIERMAGRMVAEYEGVLRA